MPDNASNMSTLYNGAGAKTALNVGVDAGPTGTVFSGITGQFQVGTTATPTTLGTSNFIFASQDGKIRAWRGGSTAGLVVADRSNVGASYTGLALAGTGAAARIYAADLHNQRVDVFDGSWALATPVGAFVDRKLPDGYSPFGIQTIQRIGGTRVFVAYAKLDAAGEDEEHGPGLGIVDVYDTNGVFLHRVTSHGGMNAPWGLTQAPASFGPFAGDLLIGNFGDGVVQAFRELPDGSFDHEGVLRDQHGLRSSSTASGRSSSATPAPTPRPGRSSTRPARTTRRTASSARSRRSSRRRARPTHGGAAFGPRRPRRCVANVCSLSSPDAGRVPGGALPDGADPRARGMPFNWSLNPYMGCVHRCTFCYVRAFEQRADRPSDDRYGRSIRVKTNVVDVLRAQLARPSWRRESVAIGAATDPYQPAEGRYRLTRGCIEALAARAHAAGADHPRAARRARRRRPAGGGPARRRAGQRLDPHRSTPSSGARTEPGTAPPAQRLRALRTLVDAGVEAGVGMAPILPGLSDRPEQMEAVVAPPARPAPRGSGSTC